MRWLKEGISVSFAFLRMLRNFRQRMLLSGTHWNRSIRAVLYTSTVFTSNIRCARAFCRTLLSCANTGNFSSICYTHYKATFLLCQQNFSENQTCFEQLHSHKSNKNVKRCSPKCWICPVMGQPSTSSLRCNVPVSCPVWPERHSAEWLKLVFP